MRYSFYLPLLFILPFCQKSNKQLVRLPESGIWVNYKYPLYLRDMRSARFVQNQIYISSVEFRKGDSLVWVQFRMQAWKPFKASYLGERKWLLHEDSSDLKIPLEMTLNDNGLIVAYDMFHPVLKGGVLGTAFTFYADSYQNGEKMVKFYDSGKIIGLDSFITFKPIVEYSTEPGKGDRILLQTRSWVWKKFGLIISDWDSLEIYELNNNKLGKRMYKIHRTIKPIYID